MAKSVSASSLKRGFRKDSTGTPWATHGKIDLNNEVEAHIVTRPCSEVLTSEVSNQLGLNVLRTRPTIYDGNKTAHDLPEWWTTSAEVDVLICGGRKPIQ